MSLEPFHVVDARNVSVVSQNVSVAANFVVNYKVSKVAKLRDTEGTLMSPSLARLLV